MSCVTGVQTCALPISGCCNTAFFDAVFHAVNVMMPGAETGRKALVVFSDGDDHSSAHNMMESIETAQAHDVVLFDVCYPEPSKEGVSARNKYGIGVMQRMARETGGAYFDTREKGLAENFKQIGEQLRSSYELAYHSTRSSTDQTFHKIVIRSKRDGLNVIAKTGYYAR
jgi:Ca-activated chloride channel family protein